MNLGPASERTEHLGKPRQRLEDWPLGNAARESGHDVRAKQVGCVDEPLPVVSGLGARERIAIDAQAADPPRNAVGRLVAREHLPHPGCETGQVEAADGATEGELKGLESMRQQLSDHLGCAVVGGHDCAQPDVVV